MSELSVNKEYREVPFRLQCVGENTVGGEEHEWPCISCSSNGANWPIWRKWSVSFMQSRPKMDDTSPLPPTIQKWSQNILDTNAAIFHIWNHSLHSSDPETEPQYQGPADTQAPPIVGKVQTQLCWRSLTFMCENSSYFSPLLFLVHSIFCY